MNWKFEQDGIYATHILEVKEGTLKVIENPFHKDCFGLIIKKAEKGTKLIPVLDHNDNQLYSTLERMKQIVSQQYRNLISQ